MADPRRASSDPRLAAIADPRLATSDPRTANLQPPPPPSPPPPPQTIDEPALENAPGATHNGGNPAGADSDYKLRFCTVCASNQNRYGALDIRRLFLKYTQHAPFLF